MKTFLFLIASLTTTSSFAVSSGAVEKFISFVPVGNYVGTRDSGEFCQVMIENVNFPKNDLQVKIINVDLELTKLIEEDSSFGYKDFKKEFIQTERTELNATGPYSVERIVRTVSSGAKKQYLTVSYAFIDNVGLKTANAADCVIDLP
jgi:hypothetical protein